MAVRKEKEVSIFRNGRSRAIRIPAEFELQGDSVIMSQDENGIIQITPKRQKKSWAEILDFLAQEGPIDIPEVEDYPPKPLGIDWDEEK